MAAVQRKTDANTGGGTISSTPQSTVFANSKLVSVNGSSVTTHGTDPAVHSGTVTANGSDTVKVGILGVNRDTDVDSCTHVRTGGYDKVKVG